MDRTRKLSLITTLVTLAQIGSGGLVRATGSGEGCPDWPRCFGRWIPPLEYHALIEYSHRALASAAIVLVVSLAVVAVRRHRDEPRVLWPAVVAAGTIFGLAGIGAAVVRSGLNETTVTIHIAIAMLLVAMLVYTTVTAHRLARGESPAGPPDRTTGRLALASAGATLALILLGADVRGSGAALVFPDWPLMNGALVPELDGLAVRHFAHRAAALAAGVLVAALAWRAWRARPRNDALAGFSLAAAVLFVAQSLLGAAQIWTSLAAAPVALHVWFSSLVWASLVATVAFSQPSPAAAHADAAERRTETHEPAHEPVRFADRARAYVQLTKPRIIVLLLVTTVPTMILAHGGMPSLLLIAATLVGGTLAAGSANSINCYVDRDIDQVMNRTRARPIPQHRVEPEGALWFGIALGIVATLWLTVTVNALAAGLALSAILFYVFVYTMALKRSTPQNIVIGGAAGAVPVLVGWAAVTGRLDAAPVILFFIIYYWTPPHFWALAMRYENDYAAAKIPMLPVIADATETTRQIVLYSLLLIAVTLLFYPVAQMGYIYLGAAIALGAAFLWHAVRLRRNATPKLAMGLFKYSITYLTLLFGAVALDTFVHIA